MNVNEKLRKDSGNVNIAGRLVGFLYDLMRDHIVPGKIEELVRDSEKFDNKDVNYFSNGWLAKYAENIADRLKYNYKYVLYYNNLNNQIEKILEDQNFDKIVGFIQSHEKYKNLNYVIQFPCKSFYNIDINIDNKNEIILSKFNEIKIMVLKRKLYISIIRPIKYFYQRLVRGFDDSDLWDLDQTIVQFILPRIKEFQRKYQDHCLDPNWKENLNIIVKTFEILNKKQPFERSEAENEFIKNGLRLFAENLETLWD